jgi:hypothetical protein
MLENNFEVYLNLTGTHAGNTKELVDLKINSFNVVGDSSYEIEASTSDFALERVINDKRVLDLMSQVYQIHQERKANEKSLNTLEDLTSQNRIAEKLIQIETIFKKESVTYVTMQHIIKESVSYRPSKNKLKGLLKNYLDEELGENSKLASNTAVISSINPKSSINIKFLAFDTILSYSEVLSVIKKIENVHPVLIVYNKYRGDYFFYSTTPINQNLEVKEYFDSAEHSILRGNSSASLKETKDNYRIIRCSSTLNDLRHDDSYFAF